MTTPPPPVSDKAKQEKSLWQALQLAWELGYLIALPAVFFGLGGAFLDRSAGTMPLFMLLGFALAAVTSFIAVRRRVKEVLSP